MQKISNIFLIDDDPIFKFLMKTHLKKLLPTVKVFCFEDGQIALEKIKEILPDLIFLDLNMPMMDGWAFLASLEKLKLLVDFNIYMTTASLNRADQAQTSKYSLLKGFLVKPLMESEISLLLRETFDFDLPNKKTHTVNMQSNVHQMRE